jgi:hypothetical protein
MSGNFIVSQSTRPRNGRTLTDAFAKAFNIPTNDNRILVQTTRDFSLSFTGLVVGKGSIGKVVEMQKDGQLLLVDFGLAGYVVRFPVGSDLIEFVEAVQDAS